MDQNLGHIRKEYLKGKLSIDGTPEDPLLLFSDWLEAAIETESSEPTAMVLSTADTQGFPSSRIVLLKGLENGRFLFFTNHNSRKGKELTENNRVALLFFWPGAERQVRISGLASLLPVAESEAYFHSRPYESQIGAHASFQSQLIPDRKWLEERVEKLLHTYPEGSFVPKPDYWGGYAVTPRRIEFWQGREARLHDRIEYQLDNGRWARHRLSP